MFHLSIVTPEKVFYEAEVASVVVPGTEGYLGVLSNHAPLITALKPGQIELRDADNKIQLFAVSGGFLEVSSNTATLLADAVEKADEINVERAQAAYDRQRELIAKAGDSEIAVDLAEARAAMERAANRMRVHRDNL
ncbi:MAG: ATP synthase F1 subunit epsilon [Candidatus Zixiibacteriota bacterium]